MRVTIEDLESLQELNDELEENHVDTEKSLQEDIGTLLSRRVTVSLINCTELKDTQLRDQTRKIESFEESTQDLEGTIVQFRELVMQLQGSVFARQTQRTLY